MAVKRTAGKPCNEGTEKRGKDTQKRTMEENDRNIAMDSMQALFWYCKWPWSDPWN